ncbi:sugar-transfer associated ATP-grasp domain-containing protein [Polaribacter cellanae]|uniref:Alpha-L-glutamate ligase-related protein ATP-grasp domain-containing protein n=1 Tax=Polaribacter cellanae TaxID=2818493 RepID=A0A975H7S1_9FLAO|nr:sugar-transfer associated ATP-grasp domain-containing protein [Polaribacter cellanae]QTE23264.1 hypothetical protein J3359_03030 [Polaribacter cellanae]
MLNKIFKIQNPLGVIGINKRNLELIYPNNKKRDYSLADDKVKTKEILHKNNIACAETYAVIKKISEIKQKWESCKRYKALVIKPSNGFGGEGIKVLKKSIDGKWISGGNPISEIKIFQHITSIVSGVFSMTSNDSCLIEECIIPHPFFAEIYGDGVPDFRIITYKGTPVMSMLRMPTSKSNGKANLHQDGVGIGINMLTGKLTQVFDGKRYSDHHPDKPAKVSGKPIPYWDKILQLSIDTAMVFPLHYLGIDIVIDKIKGPQIMEINVRPGLAIQSVNKCGMTKAIKLLVE